jgi:hypothetical protein
MRRFQSYKEWSHKVVPRHNSSRLDPTLPLIVPPNNNGLEHNSTGMSALCPNFLVDLVIIQTGDDASYRPEWFRRADDILKEPAYDDTQVSPIALFADLI